MITYCAHQDDSIQLQLSQIIVRKGVQLFRRTDERRFRRSIFSIVSEGGMVKLDGKKGKKKKKISVTIDENLLGDTKRWPKPNVCGRNTRFDINEITKSNVDRGTRVG